MKILIVDDEIQNREALTEVLKRLGHEVVTSPDGANAFHHISTKKFDAIFSDIRMPIMDGFQFFETAMKHFEKTGESTPFVFMTAFGKLDEAVNAMKRGAFHFLTKPLKKKDIIEVLAEITSAPEYVSKQDGAIQIAVGSTLQSLEDKLIEETLKSCGGDKNKAAAILGINPRTIHRWIKVKAGHSLSDEKAEPEQGL